jgi:hypothetical protein
MSNVYVVSSTYRNEFEMNPSVLILRAFTNRDSAEAWIDSEIKRDPGYNEDYDGYEIQEVSLYE